MWRTGLLSFALAASLFGANVEPGDTYEVLDDPEVTLIIAREYSRIAPQALALEKRVLYRYENSFGYRLDAPLYLGIASSKNQIANAFSTQIPLNMQIHYIAGALHPDYFASTSWMKTLLFHESAHNFQLNAKNNPISRIAHHIVGNTPVTWAWFAPIFPLPNLTESSFILEGNAVLNESLFGNGGRLYSGAFWAMTLLQAKAGYITPRRVYNDHLYFPYGAHHYIVGGFFQLFLARRYGLAKTNRYFLAYSDQWLPFFTNAVYREHFGKSFEQLLAAYNDWLLTEAKGFRQSRGEVVAYSQKQVPLNSDVKEICFLTSDARHAPRLIRVNKESGKVKREKTNHLFGKIFAIGPKYYTLASGHVAGDKVMAGLFDSEGHLLRGTEGKAMQCFLPAGEKLYFDIAASYDMPHLYRDDKYLGTVNSSVLCDYHGDYYYFRQEGTAHVLYRDEKRMFSFEGHYGKVADVDSRGRVIFVANSAKGSTLYRTEGKGAVVRLAEGDDILDARLLNDDTAIAEVIQSDGIVFMKIPLHARSAAVANYEILPGQHRNLKPEPALAQSAFRPYHPLKNLHYSALEQFLSLKDDGSADFNLEARFSDPLEQNALRLFLSTIDKETRIGVGYDNSAHIVTFGGDIYAADGNDANISSRGYGLDGYISWPFYRETYRRGDFRIDGHLDRDKEAKSPLALSFSLKDRRKFGIGFYPNSLDALSLFSTSDRGDLAYGADYKMVRDVGRGFYCTAALKYARSNTSKAGKNEHGIWIDESGIAAFRDPSRFFLPSLPYDIYTREAMRGEFSVAKMFSYSRYYFSVPLSLRQESLYATYRYLHLKNHAVTQLHEVTLGLRAELLVLHKIVIPVSFEWMHNDDIGRSRDFRFVIDMKF